MRFAVVRYGALVGQNLQNKHMHEKLVVQPCALGQYNGKLAAIKRQPRAELPPFQRRKLTRQ
jgi:hypothetical protein